MQALQKPSKIGVERIHVNSYWKVGNCMIFVLETCYPFFSLLIKFQILKYDKWTTKFQHSCHYTNEIY